jgi:hypothetical protein
MDSNNDLKLMDIPKELAIHLTKYIKEKHTQQECNGYIDGFKQAMSIVFGYNRCTFDEPENTEES